MATLLPTLPSFPLQNKRNVQFNLNYALIFCTKRCAAVLQGERIHYCAQELKRLCASNGIVLHSYLIKHSYVVLYLGLTPEDKISTVVKTIKGVLARKLLQRFPELRIELPDTQMWAPMYFASSLGQLDEDTLRDFVACAAQTISRK